MANEKRFWLIKIKIWLEIKIPVLSEHGYVVDSLSFFFSFSVNPGILMALSTFLDEIIKKQRKYSQHIPIIYPFYKDK